MPTNTSQKNPKLAKCFFFFNIHSPGCPPLRSNPDQVALRCRPCPPLWSASGAPRPPTPRRRPRAAGGRCQGLPGFWGKRKTFKKPFGFHLVPIFIYIYVCFESPRILFFLESLGTGFQVFLDRKKGESEVHEKVQNQYQTKMSWVNQRSTTDKFRLGRSWGIKTSARQPSEYTNLPKTVFQRLNLTRPSLWLSNCCFALFGGARVVSECLGALFGGQGRCWGIKRFLCII